MTAFDSRFQEPKSFQRGEIDLSEFESFADAEAYIVKNCKNGGESILEPMIVDSFIAGDSEPLTKWVECFVTF